MKKPQWITCARCGKVDESKPAWRNALGYVAIPAHTGTRETMLCPDCAVPFDGHASLCRNCCPTGHGTHP